MDEFVIKWLKWTNCVNFDSLSAFIRTIISLVTVCKLIFFGLP